MRLFPKFLAVFLAVALAPLAFVGLRLLRETERSLKESALAAHDRAARGAAEALARRVAAVDARLDLARRDAFLLWGGPGPWKDALRRLLEADDAAAGAALHDALGRPLAALARDPGAPPAPPTDWSLLRAPLLERGLAREAAAGAVCFHASVPGMPGPLKRILTLRLEAAALTSALEQGLDGPGNILLSSPSGTVLEATFPLSSRPRGEGEERDIERSVKVPGTDWTLSLRRPAALVFEPLRRARRRLAWSLLAAALAATLACLLMARRLARPLSALGEAVRRMKEGDFRAPMPPRTGDELGDLAADLREAQSSLEKRTRDSVLGRLSRMIAHDLRTPLEALETLLSSKKADPRRARIARDALAAARDCAEQIVAVGRDQPPALQPTDLNALARSALREAAGTGPRPRLRPGRIPKALMDPAAVRRAAANLIRNAREAAASRVEVSTTAEDGRVCLTVADDGPGFPPEKLARLFEEFSTKSAGAGLGLLIVKKVMDQHGGRVSAENLPGGGARVRLEFPLDA